MSDSNDLGPLDDLIENLTGAAAGDWSDRLYGTTQLPADPEQVPPTSGHAAGGAEERTDPSGR